MADEHQPTESPEHKDLQDHTFGTLAAAEQEAAEQEGERAAPPEERPEPHAGGKA